MPRQACCSTGPCRLDCAAAEPASACWSTGPGGVGTRAESASSSLNDDLNSSGWGAGAALWRVVEIASIQPSPDAVCGWTLVPLG